VQEIRILPESHMESAKQTDVLNTSLLAVTQTAVGCGLGLLLGGKMSRGAQKATAFSLLGIGALLALPAIVDAVAHVISGPATARGAKKRLDSIRHDSGLPDDAEVF
jgi:ABC-type spermidine/putrescine transport system permease subunit II